MTTQIANSGAPIAAATRKYASALHSVTSGSRYSTSSVSNPPTELWRMPALPSSSSMRMRSRKINAIAQPVVAPNAAGGSAMFNPVTTAMSVPRPAPMATNSSMVTAASVPRSYKWPMRLVLPLMRASSPSVWSRKFDRLSSSAARFDQPYVPCMKAHAAARPTSSRTVVRWLGVTQLSLSGVTKRRASRASHGLGPVEPANDSCGDSDMTGR